MRHQNRSPIQYSCFILFENHSKGLIFGYNIWIFAPKIDKSTDTIFKKQNRLFLGLKITSETFYNDLQLSSRQLIKNMIEKCVNKSIYFETLFLLVYAYFFQNQKIARERTRTPRPKTINKGKFALRCIVQKICTCENENCIAFQTKESFKTKCDIPWMQINQSCLPFKLSRK